MQPIILDKPYHFVPPYPGRFLGKWLMWIMPSILRRTWGIASIEFRGTEHVRASLQAGHGMLLPTTHGRPCDPMILGAFSRHLNQLFYCMTSRHLFLQGRIQAWLLQRTGAYSVFREGIDRESLKASIQILVDADRPLVIFPEGIVTRTNDRLGALMEGTAFIARSAAKQRARRTPPGQVVIHPVAIKHYFQGNLEAAVGPVLDEIEDRLSWERQRNRPVLERVFRVGEALLSLKEIEYFGKAQAGTLEERLHNLIERLLRPLEDEWLGGRRAAAVVERIKQLRIAILAEMIDSPLTESERARRWRQFGDIYLAQQLICYPPDYLTDHPTVERVLETVERFEEDLTDTARIHRPLRVVVQVGEALVVPAGKDRGGIEETLMNDIQQLLQGMLTNLSRDSTPLPMPADALLSSPTGSPS